MQEETINATYIQSIFISDDSTFKVALVKTDDDKTITISGNFMPLEEGLNYEFKGFYRNHPKYGKQFVVSEVNKASNSKLGLINYFSSEKFKGIGNKIASEIVKKLGENAIEKILENESVLDGIPNLSKGKKDLFVATLKQSELLNTIYTTLYSYGLTSKMIHKLVENYELKTLEIIRENPYRLIYELDGFGFQKSDKIALQSGIKKDNPIRIKEAILYSLQEECYGAGNIFILLDELIESASKLLDLEIKYDYKKIINDLATENRLILQENRVYPLKLFKAEDNVARRLREIFETKSRKEYSKEELNLAYQYASDRMKINYTPLQKEAIMQVFSEKISIITGGPGTGKTTLVKGILEAYSKLTKKDLDSDEFGVLLIAPTGKAAKRLRESTNYDASTIHKALGYNYDGHFCFDEINKLPYNLVIVDESSMIDIELANNLLKAISNFARIIFIGDENQLPSVGPGEFLHDIINSNTFRVFRLKEVMRQVADSNIIRLANMVLNQRIDYSVFNTKKEVFYYNCVANDFFDRLKPILDAYFSRTNGSFENLQILIPMYAGKAGIDATNEYIQKNYNKNQNEKLIYGERVFLLGDKVLQLQNNPEKDIMNGDTGFIVEIKKVDNKDTIIVDFGQKLVTLDRGDLDNLTLAYAISVHKSQGSEYENVILPIFSSYQIMLKKKLIYTGITRAKKKLILFGDLNLLSQNISYKEKLRNTTLMRLLMYDLKKGIIINDPLSAFNEIKEELNGLTPYDFL